MRKLLIAAVLLSCVGQAQAQRYYAREKVMKTADAPAKPATASTCSLTSPNVVYTFTGSIKVVGQKSMPFSGNADTVRVAAKDLCESFAETTACEAFVNGNTLLAYAYSITGGRTEYRSDQNYGRTYPWAGACAKS